MKKIYYLLALLPLAFTSCQKQPIVPVPALTNTATLSFTLAAADYQLLPSNVYANASHSFNSAADANNYIPTILNAKESKQLNNGSTAAVTYTLAPPTLTLSVADSLFKDVAYTVTAADYAAVAGTYTDFSAAQAISFLKYKYPTPVANQLAVITYTYYNGVDATVTNSFLYLNGAWLKIYQISAAQYTTLNLGSADFGAANLATLPADFNALLKVDANIMDTVKTNDIIYVSYKYYVSSAKTYQKVMPVEFDGTNFANTPTPTQVTGNFLKTNGVWDAVIPVPSIGYTLTKPDMTLIAASAIGTAAERTNLGTYFDFETAWTTADLDSAMILVLTTDFPKPQQNILYKVTYPAYVGGTDVPTVLSFINNGTAWVAQQ